MASGIFAVLDDIAALMDDVAVASKLATKKTAGILGDDLAVNAEKATGFLASREIPVLWAITKGSLVNKLIIVPIALLLTHYLPAAITIVLLLGGAFLAYEGAEKIIEFLFHRQKKGVEVIAEAVVPGPDDEKAKIKSAITTDFILSVEIVIIAIGSLAADVQFATKVITVSVVALLATVGVYGIVALIVRMDDAGFRLMKNAREGSLRCKFGGLLVKALPWIIKALGVIGTLALILVSGGIFVHNLEFIHHLVESFPSIVGEGLVGLVVGVIVVGVVTVIKKIMSKK
jgi:predicted DNA repair protein MutK